MRRIVISSIISYLILFANTECKTQVVINEILASNTYTNIDDFSKNFIDWIELYNPSDHEMSIGDWYLTDNKTKPTKWKIPFYNSIAANDYKLFWADGINNSNHTNFKLNINGEAIYLFNKDTILVDSITYPSQMPDISYGRARGDLDQLVYFHEATPMKVNSLNANTLLDFVSEPKFSEKAGYYEEPLSLKLSAFSDTEEIFYTLDGTIPTQASFRYVQAIEINSTTVIRARAFSHNKLPSKVITQTYFMNESSSLPVVSLVTDPKYLWDKNIGIYVKGNKYIENVNVSANYFQAWERPANIEYFGIDGEQGINMKVGIRIHGKSSRKNYQKSLVVETGEKYDNQAITNEKFCERFPDTIKTFLLRNGGNDWGMTMFLDGLVHTLVIDKIDMDAQLYQPAIVFINGEYWGIHNIREKINAHYLKSNHGNKSTKIDILEPDFPQETMVAVKGNTDEYNKMIKFIENNSLSIDENYAAVKEYIDIGELINYLATEVYIGNRDWPYSNLKCWKFRDDSSKWRWILFDTDLSFIKSSEHAKFNMLEHMLAVNSDDYVTPPWSNYLIRKLFESDEFKNEFIQKMAVYLGTVFESEHVLQVMDSLKQNIEPEVERNFKKWGGLRQNAARYLVTSKTHKEWEANINFIKIFVEDRPSVLRKEMTEYFQLKDTVKLRLQVNDKIAGNISIMGYKLHEGNFNDYVFSDIPIKLEAIPNEGYEFVKWKGGDYERDCVINLTNNKKLTAIFRKIEDS